MKVFLENPFLFEYFGLVTTLLLMFGASFLWKKLEVAQKGIAIALMVLPVAYFYIILEAHLLNIPYTDDFNLLETIYNFKHASGFEAKVKILFEQVNQHRFAVERIVMLLMAFFTGTVNVKAQIIIGDLFLLGILYLLYKAFRSKGFSLNYFIPVPYVLFNLVYFENAFWGIAALQNTPLIFFAMLSAYGLSRGSNRGFWLGVVAALLTTFTSGSGLLTWIAGTIILAFQKRFRLLIPWLAVSVGVILFYFLFSYQVVKSDNGSVFQHPVFNTIFFFGFLGNAFFLDVHHPLYPKFYPDIIACVLLGAAITGIFILWFGRIVVSKKPVWSDWFLLGAMMFVMGTAAMFVISRPIPNYVMYGGNVFSRRYMIFGIAILATVYVCTLLLTKEIRILKQTVATLGLAVFVGLNFVSYYTSIVQIRKLHDELMLDSYFWKNYKTFLSVGEKFSDIPFWNHPTRMRDLVDNLRSSGLNDFYKFHSIPDQHVLIRETAGSRAVRTGAFNASVSTRNTDNNVPSPYYTFRLSGAEHVALPACFVFESKKYTLVLPAVPVPNHLGDFFRTFSYYGNDLQYEVFKAKLPEGTYQTWIMNRDRGTPSGWRSWPVGRQVVIR